jgi:hypothetical protein
MNRQINSLRQDKLFSKTTVVWLALMGAIVLSACRAAPVYSETDEVAIYAAVVRRIYTQDDTFGGNLQPPTLYIRRMTDDSVGDPDIDKSESKALEETVRSGIEQAVADLPARIAWIDDLDDVPRDSTTRAIADGGAQVILGNVHLQKDGSALVSSSIYIAPLAAGGQTYVVEQVDGVWAVTGTTGVVWMS